MNQTIEERVIGFLTAQISDVMAFTEIPPSRPDKCIVVTREDIGYSDCLNEATIAVRSVALSKLDALDLDENVKRAMLDYFPTRSDIASVSVGGGDDSSDQMNKTYSYRTYYNVAFYDLERVTPEPTPAATDPDDELEPITEDEQNQADNT